MLTFRDEAIKDPAALFAYISKHPTTLKLRPDQKLVYTQEWKDKPAMMQDISRLIEALPH